MSTLTETYIGKCRLCGKPLYHHPAKILLESKTQPPINMGEKRIVYIKCNNSDCNRTMSLEFPTEFIKL